MEEEVGMKGDTLLPPAYIFKSGNKFSNVKDGSGSRKLPVELRVLPLSGDIFFSQASTNSEKSTDSSLWNTPWVIGVACCCCEVAVEKRE